jgi:Ca2+:H+ antiporter
VKREWKEQVTRKLLWGSLVLVPIAGAARFLGVPPLVQFVLAAAALSPLAWVISEATEQAGQRTGPTVGGLLNATFANVPELMIALFAVADGLFEVVRGSLSGSILGNLLLVLGLSLAAGGAGELDRSSTRLSIAVIALAVPAFAIAAAPNLWSGDEGKAYATFVFPVACVLLVVYGIALWHSIRRKSDEEESGGGGGPGWSLKRSLVALGLATIATALMSETITGSISEFARQLHVSEFFAAAVVVAVAGNAAEHGAAVVVALHGELKLAADVALESAAQVAAFLVPAIALISWLVKPLPLAFSVVELLVLASSVALAAVLLHGGVSSRSRGVALVAAYAIVVVAFLLK